MAEEENTEKNILDSEKAEKMADVMKAVFQPLRLRIIAMLCCGDE